jgi:hypothetical protein
VIYFPTEFTLFRSSTELQERIVFPRTKDALKIAINISPTTIIFAVPSVGTDGAPSLETLNLRLYSTKNANAYTGTWTTQDSTGTTTVPLACSVF